MEFYSSYLQILGPSLLFSLLPLQNLYKKNRFPD
jgi:hypothetical protein